MGRLDGILPDPAILTHMALHGTYDCQLHHHTGKTCINYALTYVLPKMLVMSSKLYLPIHLIPKLFFARKLLREE